MKSSCAGHKFERVLPQGKNYRLIIVIVLFYWLALTGLSRISLASDIKIKEPVVILHERIKIALMPDGKIMRLSFKKRDNKRELLVQTSEDGLSWSEPVVVRKEYDGRIAQFLVDHEGEIQVFFVKDGKL